MLLFTIFLLPIPMSRLDLRFLAAAHTHHRYLFDSNYMLFTIFLSHLTHRIYIYFDLFVFLSHFLCYIFFCTCAVLSSATKCRIQPSSSSSFGCNFSRVCSVNTKAMLCNFSGLWSSFIYFKWKSFERDWTKMIQGKEQGEWGCYWMERKWRFFLKGSGCLFLQLIRLIGVN